MVLAVWSDGHWSGLRDAFLTVAVLFPFVVGFSAIGLFALMPLVRLFNRRGVPAPQALSALAIVGAGLGCLLLFLLPFVSAWLGAVAGALTVALWAFTNPGVFRRTTTP
jgi:hypothetical protein